MKEIKKPEPFSPDMEKAVGQIQEKLKELGVLDKHEEKYHHQIAHDHVVMLAAIKAMMPEDEGNALVRPFQNQLFSSYFTVLTVSQYQLDVYDLITSYTTNFKELMEGD